MARELQVRRGDRLEGSVHAQQDALAAKPSDPDNLDADDDGIACEQRFGETGQQVQVHPTGGVDTGGDPTDA